MKNAASINPRNVMKNMTSNNLTNESTATVKMTAPKINEMLNNLTPKENEVKKAPQPITNSEPITHGKSDKEHTMELNQSGQGQKNTSLNNPHPSRQVDSGGEDHLTKALNDGLKGRFAEHRI